ncbi:hypothetical protein JET14_13285 [Martelella lutilitoris]|uniref:Uncharacterized protein n=1 Tax=Martelella lutilitoris TaxID=2583532 RepID=A0A7T7KK34_9HYPH|nr:hypothetical protein [Martelella lutilitoris]QQM29300.1 hypothetical protein JET14_13285 [Martelella lutilitoris]
MANIVSNYHGPLGLPGGVVLRPGVAANVENWSKIKNHNVVKQWLDAKVIEVQGEEEEADDGAKVEIPTEGYAVVSPSSGWYAIAHNGEIVTKSLRKADVEGFDDMSDEDKAAFVDLHKPTE